MSVRPSAPTILPNLPEIALTHSVGTRSKPRTGAAICSRNGLRSWLPGQSSAFCHRRRRPPSAITSNSATSICPGISPSLPIMPDCPVQTGASSMPGWRTTSTITGDRWPRPPSSPPCSPSAPRPDHPARKATSSAPSAAARPTASTRPASRSSAASSTSCPRSPSDPASRSGSL